MKKRTKDSLNILGIIFAIVLLGKLFVPIINSPGFKQFIEGMGIFGPLIVILYVVVSHVLAPVTGSPMLFLSAGIFGLKHSLIYFYIGGMFSSAINFWIARKYGRKWVVRLAGKSAMSDIDNFVKMQGNKVLLLSRIFGFALFDFISYAAGLTKISFKKYYLITLGVGAFVSPTMYFVFRNLDLQSERGIMIWAVSLLTVAIAFTFIFRGFLNKKSKT